MFKRFLVLLLALPLAAQQFSARYTFTAAGDSSVFNNSGIGCSGFSLSYSSTGFSAETVALQSSVDNATWVSFDGTPVSGTNPSTATNYSLFTATGFVPYVRVDVSGLSGSGTVTALLQCWKSPNYIAKPSPSIIPPPPVQGYQPNQGIAGCGVEYVTGLTFSVGKCTFTINGLTWVAPATTVTSAAADNTNPRIDVIVAQITSASGVGLITILQGTAATPAVVPVVDYSIEIPLSHYTVAAMATTPTEPAVTLLYDETGGSEWTPTVTTHFNCSSTSNPYHLTKDCEATAAVLTNSIKLVKPAAGTIDLSTVNSLVFYIRSKAQWPTGTGGANAARSLAIFWLNGSTQVGLQIILKDGTFGFSSSNTTTYQQISIPIGLFQVPTGTLATTVEFLVAGTSGTASIGFYIDECTLQSGNTIISLSPPAIHVCNVTFGDPGAASPVLANDNDAPDQCGNIFTKDWTLSSVSCKSDGGSPTLTPILTGGTSTSILTGAVTCGQSWSAGTLNGSPVVHAFSYSGSTITCPTTPCTVDANITSAGGVAKYIVLQIVGTL